MGLTNITGEQYIRKVIQIEINIQEWKSYSVRTLVGKLSDRLLYDDLKKPEIIDLIAKGVERNPRQVKRLINRYVVVRSASESSKRQFETKKFFVGEILDDRWPDFYQRLTRPNFLKELKDYLDKTAAEQDGFFANLQKEKDVQKDKSLTDFQEIILLHKNDEDLWKFVNFNRGTIFVSEKDAKTKVEEESVVAKDWERYQLAKNSTNIPINTEVRRGFYDYVRFLRMYFSKLSTAEVDVKEFWSEGEVNLKFILVKLINEKYRYNLTEAESAKLQELYANISVLLKDYKQAEMTGSAEELKNMSRKLFTLYSETMDMLELFMRR